MRERERERKKRPGKKHFREMKKNVGMTFAQKSKEIRVGSGNGINLCCIYPANNPYIILYVHYNLKLPNVYVGIVGWMYRTKIDPISTPYLLF